MDDRRQLEIKAKLFRGFADPSRLAILEVLRSAPATVGKSLSRLVRGSPTSPIISAACGTADWSCASETGSVSATA